jgi:RNA polymerase sigma factor (sigma-70 family)
MEKTYESLSTYLMLSKKIINKFAPKFIVKDMLNDEDAVSDVATAIMNADKNFDPDREGSTNQKKTKYSYRNQCGLWAIKTYITKKYKDKKINSLDYIIDDNNNNLYSTIPDIKNKDPLENIIDNEYHNNLISDVEYILNSGLINEKQKDQIKMYYFENKSLAEIGRIYGVTREAVRQNIKRAIKNIKSLV